MHTSRFERLLPLSGVLAGLLFAAPALIARGQPSSSATDPTASARWIIDHQGAVGAGGAANGYFCVAMLLFATALRAALRSGEPRESTYSSVAYAGGIVVALAVAIQGWFSLTATSAAGNDLEPVVTTMAYLGEFGWIPWVAGSAVLFLGAGLGGLRTATLPKPLAIVAVVMGVLCLLGPTGIAVWFLTPFWLIASGVILYRRGVSQTTTPSSTPQGAAAVIGS
jgi:hypothetical protein